MDNMEQSAAKIMHLALFAPKGHSLVFLGHNGPACLGSQPSDICSKDFDKGGGDHGDPDFAQALEMVREWDVSQGQEDVVDMAAGRVSSVGETWVAVPKDGPGSSSRKCLEHLIWQPAPHSLLEYVANVSAGNLKLYLLNLMLQWDEIAWTIRLGAFAHNGHLGLMAASQVQNFWPSMFGLRDHYPLAIKCGAPLQGGDKSKELLQAILVYSAGNSSVFCCTRRSHIVDCIDNGWPDVHKMMILTRRLDRFQ
ncbi:hypothetical protein SELMODRAFT_405478 [Selaginella moellendorffii]|uniref:Uncharacterized protein n=1 Tax=Selaginella moellendorffii TaxID=88036 RepID=D8QYQ0_SELML|nr:hypothetical protein SELMODRAFT_405478 [Selaginella moellendorffii]